MLDILLNKKLLPPKNILLFDTDPSRLEPYADRGVQIAASNRELAARSVMVVLAVKPQTMEEILREIKPESSGRRYISIAAGVTTAFIRDRLESNALVARVMPNAPLALAAGATVIAQDQALPPEMTSFVEKLFSCMGTIAYLPEDKLNEVIGVSATSPAFFFRMAHALALAAQEQGIPYTTALLLVCQSMNGSARMLSHNTPPERLISMVASPGGTTEAAMQVLDRYGFDSAMRDAALRCTERAYELSEGMMNP